MLWLSKGPFSGGRSGLVRTGCQRIPSAEMKPEIPADPGNHLVAGRTTRLLVGIHDDADVREVLGVADDVVPRGALAGKDAQVPALPGDAVPAFGVAGPHRKRRLLLGDPVPHAVEAPVLDHAAVVEFLAFPGFHAGEGDLPGLGTVGSQTDSLAGIEPELVQEELALASHVQDRLGRKGKNGGSDQQDHPDRRTRMSHGILYLGISPPSERLRRRASLALPGRARSPSAAMRARR